MPLQEQTSAMAGLTVSGMIIPPCPLMNLSFSGSMFARQVSQQG